MSKYLKCDGCGSVAEDATSEVAYWLALNVEDDAGNTDTVCEHLCVECQWVLIRVLKSESGAGFGNVLKDWLADRKPAEAPDA